jgi:hypothetical protein
VGRVCALPVGFVIISLPSLLFFAATNAAANSAETAVVLNESDTEVSFINEDGVNDDNDGKDDDKDERDDIRVDDEVNGGDDDDDAMLLTSW